MAAGLPLLELSRLGSPHVSPRSSPHPSPAEHRARTPPPSHRLPPYARHHVYSSVPSSDLDLLQSYRSTYRSSTPRTRDPIDFLIDERPRSWFEQIQRTVTPREVEEGAEHLSCTPRDVAAGVMAAAGLLPHRRREIVTQHVGPGGSTITIIEPAPRHAGMIGEGPRPLRWLCFLAGLGLVGGCIMGMLNLPSLVMAPTSLILQLYLLIFGLLTLLVETKDAPLVSSCVKRWLSDWFRFLTVPGGKGAFYFFSGSLGASLWFSTNFISFVFGIYTAVMGLICMVVHLGLERQLARTGLQVYRGMDPTDPTSGAEVACSLEGVRGC